MILGINESKTLKHISYECRCKFDETKCKSNQWWNNNTCWCECKKHILTKNDKKDIIKIYYLLINHHYIIDSC